MNAEPALLAKNPADKAQPPTAKEAKSPEMQPWTANQLSYFLDRSRKNSALHTAWYVLAHTGMRRGELLALRWRDTDLEAAALSVRRSVGLVRIKGEGKQLLEGATKTSKPRVIDLDDPTVSVLKAHKVARGGMSLSLTRDDALVFGDSEGDHLHPERFSRTFKKPADSLHSGTGGEGPRAAGDPSA